MTWRLKTETVRRQTSPISLLLTPVFPHHMLWVMPALLTQIISLHDSCRTALCSYLPSQSCTVSFLQLSQTCVVLTPSSVMAVPGLGHGGVSRPHCPRWRQLSDHPCAATHGRDAGARADTASATLQAAGGQHDAERHPERPHLCCARAQVWDDRSSEQE